MANKRTLKKLIHNICGNIAVECVIAAENISGIDKQRMGEIIGKIAGLQENTLSHFRFCFDKSEKEFDNRHAFNVARENYYKKAFGAIIAEFNDKIEEIIKEMNDALPQAQKDANKAALNG